MLGRHVGLHKKPRARTYHTTTRSESVGACVSELVTMAMMLVSCGRLTGHLEGGDVNVRDREKRASVGSVDAPRQCRNGVQKHTPFMGRV